ncbi:limbic system-associated membrane protein-like [Pollicipes pollicipes]|uniref:limbic system-associated membrane protein-like n=1 Tax=Pollicipes pollicipes TaxID=41117 RepID=UPI00188581A1|nr:limbic system-associated membrane protein-like [Pollicipes pollicipes]
MMKLILIILVFLPIGMAFHPRFVGTVQNVTVQKGREAVLSCAVENLRTYKVAWVRVDTQTILTIHRTVITRNARVTLTHGGRARWHLHIAQATEDDRGLYMCQINTDPMIAQTGYLQVVVPPRIHDAGSSTDMIVKETRDVSLVCRASGYPQPSVQWRREDGTAIQRAQGRELSAVTVVDGSELNITRISRLHMGAYLCIARNGILPAVSKRVYVKVHFGPMMLVSSQLESAYVGQRSKRLQCETEAFPRSINYWTNGQGEMITAGPKFEIKSVETSVYKVSMILTIMDIRKEDFQSYKCVAKNSLGEVDGVISLDEEPAPTTFSTTKISHHMFTPPSERAPAATADEPGSSQRVPSQREVELRQPGQTQARPDHTHIDADSGNISENKYTFGTAGVLIKLHRPSRRLARVHVSALQPQLIVLS